MDINYPTFSLGRQVLELFFTGKNLDCTNYPNK